MATGNRSIADGGVRMLRRMKQYLFDITWNEVQYVLASFPKSGRTWLRFQICSYLNFYYDLGVDLDLNSMFSIITNDGRDKLRGFDVYKFKRDKRVPIITSTHAYGTCGYLKGKPVIMLVRDPKDAFLSASYPGKQNKQSPSFMQTLKVNRRKGALRFALFMNTWADQLTRTPHTIVSYEQMKRDTAGCLRRVIELINVPVDDAIIARAVENASLANMRRLNQERGLGNSGNVPEGTRLRVNKGAAGRGKKELNPQVRDFIDETLNVALTDEAKRVLSAISDMTLTQIEMTQRPVRPAATERAAIAASSVSAHAPAARQSRELAGKSKRKSAAKASAFKKRSNLQPFSSAAAGSEAAEQLKRPDAPTKKDFWRHVDAAIVSYPGSGRESLRRLLAAYINELFSLGPRTDRALASRIVPNGRMDAKTGLPAFRWFDRADVPLIVATQRSFRDKVFGERRVVFLMRSPITLLKPKRIEAKDPKPTSAQSLASHDPSHSTVDRYCRFMNEWTPRLAQENSLMVASDELRRAPAQTLQRIVEFLRLPVDQARLEHAVTSCGLKPRSTGRVSLTREGELEIVIAEACTRLLTEDARRSLDARGLLPRSAAAPATDPATTPA